VTAIVRELQVDRAALSLDALVEDPGRLAALPFETVLELRRCVRHLDADLEAAALQRLADRGVGGNHGTTRDDDQLLSVPDASAQLGLAPSYVYELARTGALPTVRVGKYVRVRVGALRAWLAGREIALDAARSETLPSSPRDTGRRPARPSHPRPDAGRIRRAARRAPGHGQEMGGGDAGVAQHGSAGDPAPPGAASRKARPGVAWTDDDERW
jgi:excisionase family DNA binding protein